MGLKGDAPWALGVMWLLTGLVFLLMLLRLYTRIVCLASYGIDDHIYIVAFVFLLIFNIFTHLSGLYGFGQTVEEIGDPELVVKATLYECIGQGFAIVGMAIAKTSLGFFLLRLVRIHWHRIAIWAAMGLVSAASIGEFQPDFSANSDEQKPNLHLSPSSLLLAIMRSVKIRLRSPHSRWPLPD